MQIRNIPFEQSLFYLVTVECQYGDNHPFMPGSYQSSGISLRVEDQGAPAA